MLWAVDNLLFSAPQTLTSDHARRDMRINHRNSRNDHDRCLRAKASGRSEFSLPWRLKVSDNEASKGTREVDPATKLGGRGRIGVERIGSDGGGHAHDGEAELPQPKMTVAMLKWCCRALPTSTRAAGTMKKMEI